MTPQEAKIFLPHDDFEELEDVYDQKLFEVKQFFLSKFPISKVIDGRIKKLALIEQAWEVLSNEKHSQEIPSENFTFSNTQNLSEIWNEYQQARNSIKLKLQKANDVLSVGKMAKSQVNVVRTLCLKLELLPSPEGENSLLIGKEPDPMDIHFDLQRWKENGVEEVHQMDGITVDSPLGIELKRLSLWLKIESNG